jgi:hypothetical protein
MPIGGLNEMDIRRLLENTDLKITLESPSKEYQFEYYTASNKDRITGELRFTRTYRLIDLVRGGITSEPWEAYDLESHASKVTNLVKFSGYRVTKVVNGWQALCPACGHTMRGKNWEPIPKVCVAQGPKKCRSAIIDADVTELLLAGDAT